MVVRLCVRHILDRQWIRVEFALCRGHDSLDAATEMDVKKDILLERFQEEVCLFSLFVRCH